MAKSYTLKLQINERGAWRNVREFAPGQRKVVQAEAAILARADARGKPSSRVTYRITRDGREAIAYLEAPYTAWRNA